MGEQAHLAKGRHRKTVMTALFENRSAAGQVLAGKLTHYRTRSDVVVLAIPRGGVPVAWAVAQQLRAPLDVIVVERLRSSRAPQCAVGATAGGNATFVDRRAVAACGLSELELETAIVQQGLEVIRRQAMYARAIPALPPLAGRTLIVVDDGMSSGVSMRVALDSLRLHDPAWIVVALPVGPMDAQEKVGTGQDEFVCLVRPAGFAGVQACYENFEPVSDEQIRQTLAKARARV